MANCRDNCLYAPLCKYNDDTNEWCKTSCPLYKDKSHYTEIVRYGECCYQNTEDCPMREFMQDEGLDKVPTADLQYCSYGEREETQCTRG